MRDGILSAAVVAYLSQGRPPFAGGEDAVKATCGREVAPELSEQVRALMKEIMSINPDWGDAASGWDQLAHASAGARSEMAARHPDLTDDALDTFVSYFAWNWK